MKTIITLETNLVIGDNLYHITKETKNIYAPCIVCNNTRKIEYQKNGETFILDCPKCKGKQIKGNINNNIEIYVYSYDVRMINSFCYKKNNSDNKYGWYACVANGRCVDIETLICNDYGVIQYYISEIEIKAIIKERNKLERKKEKDFLNQF